MNNNLQESKWSERLRVGEPCSAMNVILVDADYVDKVAFNLIVNFERMIGRRIPQADLAKWIDCVALDGGIRERPRVGEQGSGMGAHETLVVLIHQKDKTKLENFTPSDYAKDLDGKAFKDHLGEFSIEAYPIENIAGGENYFTDALQLIATQKEVKRVMVIPNAEDPYIYNKVCQTLNRIDEERLQAGESGGTEKRITVFAMQPMAGGNFRHEILGYSLMAALGIKADEINSKS